MWNIKQIHNLSRPGEQAEAGDVVEIECVGGFVREVDPETRASGDAHQRFLMQAGGKLQPVRRSHRLNPSA